MDFKTMTKEQIAAKLSEFKQLNKEIKEARKAGLIEKAPKIEKIKSPEYLLLAGQFKAVIDSNLDTIKRAFEATKTVEKPLGNTGINFRVKDEVFYVQILSEAAMKGKKAELDAAKEKAKKAKTE